MNNQFSNWMDNIRKTFKIKGIMIYNNRSILVAGWPIGRDAANNDNEAKS